MKHTEQDIKNRLVRAVQNDTPDVLPRILLHIKQKGKSETMDTNNTVNNAVPMEATPKKKNRRMAWLAAAAVFTLLALGAGWLGIFTRTDATVYLDVNPGIELKVNTFGKVVSAKAIGPDGEAILAGMNLKNVDLNVAVNALIGSMVGSGYISESKNSVLVSVMSKSEQKGQELQQQLLQEVNGVLASSALDGAVLSQVIGADAQLQELADRYNISPGKAALMLLLVQQNPLLELPELAALPINDLCLLLFSKNVEAGGMAHTGTTSAGEYIPKEEAKAIALAHAGVNEADLLYYEIEFDYEHGLMIYEIEFDTAAYEYEYDINAVTGEIISYEKEVNDNPPQPATPSPESPAPTPAAPSGEMISAEQAKAIALAHAGLSAGQVVFTECELDHDKGRLVYEIEFCTGTYEYEYKIDAYSGAILEFEMDDADDDDHHPHSHHGHSHGPSRRERCGFAA